MPTQVAPGQMKHPQPKNRRRKRHGPRMLSAYNMGGKVKGYAKGGMVEFNTPEDQARINAIYPSKGDKIKAAEREMAGEREKGEKVEEAARAAADARIREVQKQNKELAR